MEIEHMSDGRALTEAAQKLDEFGIAWTREEIIVAISRAMRSGAPAEEVLAAIEATGCRVVYKSGTVGMVRALIQALNGEDHNPSLASSEFRQHIKALEAAISASPIAASTTPD